MAFGINKEDGQIFFLCFGSREEAIQLATEKWTEILRDGAGYYFPEAELEKKIGEQQQSW